MEQKCPQTCWYSSAGSVLYRIYKFKTIIAYSLQSNKSTWEMTSSGKQKINISTLCFIYDHVSKRYRKLLRLKESAQHFFGMKSSEERFCFHVSNRGTFEKIYNILVCPYLLPNTFLHPLLISKRSESLRFEMWTKCRHTIWNRRLICFLNHFKYLLN